jgi:hypothetical protein
VAYVDIDDTLIRSSGSKRIPMTMTALVQHVRDLHDAGIALFAWSTAGADYARATAAAKDSLNKSSVVHRPCCDEGVS